MFRRDRLMRALAKERLVVTPKTGPMFSGLLLDVDQRSYRFADVRIVDSNGEQAAQGELYIDRRDVAYAQRVIRTEKE